MSALLLIASILLSVGRNIFFKKLSGISFGSRRFFLCQGLLFLSAGGAVLLLDRIPWKPLSPHILVLLLTFG